MIDSYAWFSIVLRTIAEGIFIYIFIQQLRVFRGESEYKRLQVLLLVALFMLLFGNGFSLYLNIHRQADGNLLEAARHAGMILNGLATLGAAIALYLINKFKLK